jgi:hypothetical protein
MAAIFTTIIRVFLALWIETDSLSIELSFIFIYTTLFFDSYLGLLYTMNFLPSLCSFVSIVVVNVLEVAERNKS